MPFPKRHFFRTPKSKQQQKCVAVVAVAGQSGVTSRWDFRFY